MANVSIWLFLLILLIGIWTAVTRELRLTIRGYILQTALVAILYLLAAVRTGDPMIWAAFIGLSVIRIGFIPWLLKKVLPGDMMHQRDGNYAISPTYAIGLYILLAAVGIGIGHQLSPNLTNQLGLDFGLALATLLVAIAAIAVNHHAPKQIMSILSGDNAIDMIASMMLGQIAIIADYAIFIDVAIAIYIFSLLVLRLLAHGHSDVRKFNELRG